MMDSHGAPAAPVSAAAVETPAEFIPGYSPAGMSNMKKMVLRAVMVCQV